MAFIIAIRFALIAPSSWAYDIGDKRGQTADTGRLLYRRLDVTKPDDWRATVSEAEAVFGKLDILVSNAGVCSMAGLLDEDEATWDRTVAVNQTGAWHAMRAAVPAMERVGGGSMIMVSSIWGKVATAGATAYQATKVGGRHFLGRAKRGSLG
jgi:NAD(P)-dependent dehydrogenase (short-subunit alcohol dehydrogenase family)